MSNLSIILTVKCENEQSLMHTSRIIMPNIYSALILFTLITCRVYLLCSPQPCEVTGIVIWASQIGWVIGREGLQKLPRVMQPLQRWMERSFLSFDFSSNVQKQPRILCSWMIKSGFVLCLVYYWRSEEIHVPSKIYVYCLHSKNITVYPAHFKCLVQSEWIWETKEPGNLEIQLIFSNDSIH